MQVIPPEDIVISFLRYALAWGALESYDDVSGEAIAVNSDYPEHPVVVTVDPEALRSNFDSLAHGSFGPADSSALEDAWSLLSVHLQETVDTMQDTTTRIHYGHNGFIEFAN